MPKGHKTVCNPGDRYGQWTVVCRAGPNVFGQTRFLCACECGIVRAVLATCLFTGKTRSCGCSAPVHRREVVKTHGESGGGKLPASPEYQAWFGMKQRCLNRNSREFKRYGGRGISVHSGWIHSFETFLRHVGRKPDGEFSLDRIDNDGNYEPGNVHWATRTEQQNNKRTNHRLEFRGLNLTLAEWSENLKISQFTISTRLSRGWSVDRALTTPIRHKSEVTV